MAATATRLEHAEEMAARYYSWAEVAAMIGRIFDAADLTVNPGDAARFKAEVFRVLDPEFVEYLKQYLGESE